MGYLTATPAGAVSDNVYEPGGAWNRAPRAEDGPLRSIGTWAAVLVVCIAAAALLAAEARGQTEPPSSGDWRVYDSTVISNRTVDLRGNLTVQDGGRLTLQNVTLRVHSVSSTVPRWIHVTGHGALHLRDNDGDGSTTYDRTLVTRGVPSLPYTFLVEGGIDCRNSAIFGAGAHGTIGGLEVRGGSATFHNTTIASGHDFCLGLTGTYAAVLVNCTLTLSDGAGLKAVDSTYIEIVDCRIVSNAGDGVDFDNVSRSWVWRSNISSNAITGLRLRGGGNITIEDCLLLGNLNGTVAEGVRALTCKNVSVDGSGFWGMSLLKGCTDVRLESCAVNGSSRDGILADSLKGLAMEGCNVSLSAYEGMHVLNLSSNISLEGCRLVSNGYNGAKLENSENVSMEGVAAEGNGYHGIWFVNTGTIRVAGCSLLDDTYDGLYSDHSWDIGISGTFADGNGYNGIEFGGDTFNATVQDCTLVSNSKAGLLLSLVRDVQVERCNLSGNGFFGLRVEGSSRSVRCAGCAMAGNGEIALVVEDSTGVVAEGVTLAANAPASALWVNRNGELRVLNSTVTGRAQAKSGGRCTIIGPSAGSAITASAEGTGSYVDEGWWLSVQVLWPAGGPADGASVRAESTDLQRNATAVTGADGWARWMPIVERTTTGTGLRGHNPYKVVAAKDDASNGTSVTVRLNATLVIVLQDGEPPVAVAADVLAELGLVTFLDGSLSADNVAVATWTWSFDDGLGTVVLDGPVVNWTFTRLGRFEGELTVADAVGLSATVAFNITVEDTLAPVVLLGPDVTVPQGTTLELNGTRTRDNDPSLMGTGAFTWVVKVLPSGTPQGVLEGPFKTWDFRVMGAFTVVLSVRDQSGNVGQGSFNVTVRDTTPPTVNAGADRQVDERTTVVLEPMLILDNDPSFDSTGTVWWVVEGQRLDGRKVEWTAALPGVYFVELHARDAAGNEATSARNITVRDRTPPTVVAGEDRTVQVGTEVLLSAEGTTDNDPAFPAGATFRWTVSGPRLELERAGTRLNFTPPWIGRYIVTVVVTDAGGNAAQASVAVESVDTVPPEFTAFSPGPNELQPGTKVTITFDMRDGGTGIDPGTLGVRTGAGADGGWGNWTGVPLASGGPAVHIELELSLVDGWNRIQLRVSDLAGNGPVLSGVHLVSVNSRPVARITLPKEGAVFGPYDSVTLDGRTSLDPDANDALRYRWSSDVDGLLGDTAERVVPRLSPGRHLITLEVTDGLPGHDSIASVNVTVEPVSSPPGPEAPGWLWLVVLLVLVGAVLVIWDAWRRRAQPAPADVPSEEGVPPREPEGPVVGGPGPPGDEDAGFRDAGSRAG